jgi:hypothetical protein
MNIFGRKPSDKELENDIAVFLRNLSKENKEESDRKNEENIRLNETRPVFLRENV